MMSEAEEARDPSGHTVVVDDAELMTKAEIALTEINGALGCCTGRCWLALDEPRRRLAPKRPAPMRL